MIGTLLDDIASGLDFGSVSRKFAEKMMRYQRPQAPPSAGNRAQAEKVVEKLGIEKSLVRRFARVNELQRLWTPNPKMKERYGYTGKGKSIFGHLETKEVKTDEFMPMSTPEIMMTWEKFVKTVLPMAENIEYLVKNAVDNYAAILTAYHNDAPPIVQWDNEEQRNPFSWYVYNGGSSASRWNLTPGFTRVTAITLQPPMWYSENVHQGKGVFLILDGAKDSNYAHCGNGLFPEILKSELREIRSTLEAYSRKETIGGYDEASACGIRLQSGQGWKATVRVKTATGTTVYKLDRWD
jgi:hypothetical protein